MIITNDKYINYLNENLQSALHFASTKMPVKKGVEIILSLSQKEADLLGAKEVNLNLKGMGVSVKIDKNTEHSNLRVCRENAVAVYYCKPFSETVIV